MTTDDIRRRLLTVQRDELRRIVQELLAWPPANMAELMQACQAAEASLAGDDQAKFGTEAA